MSEYRMATGFETLFGYLKMTGNDSRAAELFEIAYAETLKNLKNNNLHNG